MDRDLSLKTQSPPSGKKHFGRSPGGACAAATVRPLGRLTVGGSSGAGKRFTASRIEATGDLLVAEILLSFDGRPSYSMRITELLDGEVARETR
jgi:hypothetical protein